MFHKILIANRGEIACRVIDTCRRLGVATVAVYSDADAGARHVRQADEAWRIGPASAAESYLDVDAVLEVAQKSGAAAIHPGYGFLSENEGFARACTDAGIVFIGPPADAIRAMGSKSAAKTLMDKADVPLTPGYHGDNQDGDHLAAEAERIGYPVMIKASAGGGGKGMRVVRSAAEFADALASCQRESEASFGDARMLVEKYLERPRHIEIQVFADQQGNTVSLFERDCSLQRRHQKVVEEAPAPGLDAAQREQMGRSACDAARAVGYVGAGTVEFIADGVGGYYFMEMNTRLQVEHPVTEMITGLDLVEWQLRVAAGEALPKHQNELQFAGHAIEVRIYAETPENGFLPSVGRLVHLVAPTSGAHVRWDSGVETGDAITPHYDPMIAKLIVHARDRDAAIARMRTALGALEIIGVGHNVGFLDRLIDHPEFRAGEVDTGLIEREIDTLVGDSSAPSPDLGRAAALALIEAERVVADCDNTPWSLGDGWRLNGTHQRALRLTCGEHAQQVMVEYTGDGLRIDGEPASLVATEGRDVRVQLGARQFNARVVPEGRRWHVFCATARAVFDYHDPLLAALPEDEAAGELTAPMPGKIVALSQQPGTRVDKGTPLVVMEAMKMEMVIEAPADGQLRGYHCAVGDQVMDGDELVDFEADA